MDALFQSLLDDTHSEISRREPGYFRRFGLAFAPVREQARRYSRLPLFQGCSQAEMEAALSAGMDHFRKRGVIVEEAAGAIDPVATLLCDSIADAFAASRGRLSLRPCLAETAGEDLEDYDERRTQEGLRYLIRRTGERPMVVVNACGMPVSLWWRLLEDRSSPWRLLIAESPSADLLEGGMRSAAGLCADASAIAAVLDDAKIDAADLLAWCSGSRIAIEVAAQLPERVRSVILVCPTLRGAAGVERRGSAFEDDLNRIFVAVGGRPQLAQTFSQAFRHRFQFSDWDKLVDEPGPRAAILFGLPAQERAQALVTPLARPEFLVNYARRVLLDQEHPVHEGLARLKMPVMLLTGDYDNRVDNVFTCAVLGRWAARFLHVSIKGAGHYLYDLQYQYFRSILSAFLAGAAPASSVRVEVSEAAA